MPGSAATGMRATQPCSPRTHEGRSVSQAQRRRVRALAESAEVHRSRAGYRQGRVAAAAGTGCRSEALGERRPRGRDVAQQPGGGPQVPGAVRGSGPPLPPGIAAPGTIARSRAPRRGHRLPQPRRAGARPRPVCPGRAVRPPLRGHSREGARPRPPRRGRRPGRPGGTSWTGRASTTRRSRSTGGRWPSSSESSARSITRSPST